MCPTPASTASRTYILVFNCDSAVTTSPSCNLTESYLPETAAHFSCRTVSATLHHTTRPSANIDLIFLTYTGTILSTFNHGSMPDRFRIPAPTSAPIVCLTRPLCNLKKDGNRRSDIGPNHASWDSSALAPTQPELQWRLCYLRKYHLSRNRE